MAQKKIGDMTLPELAAALRPLLFTNVVPLSLADVSNPPTDAQLDTAFGQPNTLSDGKQAFVAVVDDANANTTVWLVATNGTSWWYEQLTKAV